jgi:glycosyltransferase involved in cell wall biosynthesis
LKDVDLRDDQILLSGPISETDLPMLYRAASLFIFPSLMEGFGLPPAEAMAVGTPVLVSNKASLPEVVQTADCRFDPTQPESLIAKLIAAAENERQFTAPLCDRFTESYGLKRYLDLMNAIAGGNYVSS